MRRIWEQEEAEETESRMDRTRSALLPLLPPVQKHLVAATGRAAPIRQICVNRTWRIWRLGGSIGLDRFLRATNGSNLRSVTKIYLTSQRYW
jgi:hypothetical protein